MKSLLTVFIVTLFVLSKISGQCDVTYITLGSQSEVNQFKSYYGCTTTNAIIIIQNNVNNLDSLDELQSVGGLTIYQTQLINLDGLQALTKIKGSLRINYNQQLQNLNGLNNLSDVGGIDFDSNPLLSDISALSNITRIISIDPEESLEGRLFIGDCNSLTNLNGLNNLKFIDGDVWIRNNTSLPNFAGLDNLDSVRSGILIENNSGLINLNGLERFTYAKSIGIYENPNLLSLGDLSALTKVDSFISIFNNPSFTSLGNLESLREVKGFSIILCPIQSLDGLHLTKVVGDPADAYLTLFILPELTDISALSGLQRIDGDLYITNCRKLPTLDGLSNLTYIGGNLGVEEDDSLSNIDALSNIEFIGGELEISYNEKLSNCSIESVCRYLENPSGLVLIFGNGNGCKDEEEVISRCSPMDTFFILDANLHIKNSGIQFNDIRIKPVDTLFMIDESREGLAADGVSKILLKFRFNQEGRMIFSQEALQYIELPWGDETHFFEDYYYGFALFNAPEAIELDPASYLYKDKILAENVVTGFQFEDATRTRQASFSIPVVVPPVVLVHGTFSNPEKTWRTAASVGTDMYSRLQNEGFKVFTVDYEESNGTYHILSDKSSFEENAEVVWGDVYASNTGGIKDALKYYRDSLKVAVTQADVVGHSLGGVLPRVYASDHFNPDYKRAVNFLEGDINRLITLGSTHFGSNLGEFHSFLQNVSLLDVGPLEWITTQGALFITSWASDVALTEAVQDQVPPPVGMKLGMIGRTYIPSHAITLTVPKGELKDAVYDPEEEYYDLYWYITTLLYQLQDVRTAYLESKQQLIGMDLLAETTIDGADPKDLYPLYNSVMLFKTMVEDGLQAAGLVTSALDGTLQLPSDIEIFKYALNEVGMGDAADPLLQIFVAGADPVGVAAEYFLNSVQFPTVQSIVENQLKVNEETMEAIRSLIFNNDENDGVVRVQSQSGEIEKECATCVSRLENVFHGFAPRYKYVQDTVLSLLKGGMDRFNELGFPAVDHAQKLYYPPDNLDLFKVNVNNEAAICQSGISPAHAKALAKVADENNVILITRPVNPDGLELIENGAATKPMQVKPKSSNWGPQKGYLPVSQRYSKIPKVFIGQERTDKIKKYDELSQENLIGGVTVTRDLIVEACNGAFYIVIDSNQILSGEDDPEKEVLMIPVSDPTRVCYWGSEYDSHMNIEDCRPIQPQDKLYPLKVMASPTVFEKDGVTPRYLTADYDLLMTGFYKGPDQGDPEPPEPDFDPFQGQITDEQKVLLNKINSAIAATGYDGGNVVHHGPENQYSESPFIDYPLTVFAPDEIPNGFAGRPTAGVILSIEMGPPGFRDIHLKRFVNRMRLVGYDLYHNPSDDADGWYWTWDSSIPGYWLEDSDDLGDYVEQAPKLQCDKEGNPLKGFCPQLHPSNHVSNEKPDSGGGPFGRSASFITPNPVYDEDVSFSFEAEKNTAVTWFLVDALGDVREMKKVDTISGKIFETIDVSHLEAGIYSIVSDLYGPIGRFVRM